MAVATESLRKVAVLVSTLDTDAADALLEQMPAELADKVRRLVVDLDDVAEGEQEAVIREFVQRRSPAKAATASPVSAKRNTAPSNSDDGVELTPSLLAAMRTDRQPERSLRFPAEASRAPRSHPPFQLLREADPAALAPVLQNEHPQVIALVTAHLPPEQAAEVLHSLPETLRTDVLGRMVLLDEAHPEAIRDVEQALEARLADSVQARRQRQARLDEVQRLLSAATPQARRELLASLARHEPELAARLAFRPAPRLGRLEQLSDVDLGYVLRRADVELVVLALAGGSPQLFERVARQLPETDRATLRRAVDNLGPARLSDLDAAQRELVRQAQELIDSGEISFQGVSSGDPALRRAA